MKANKLLRKMNTGMDNYQIGLWHASVRGKKYNMSTETQSSVYVIEIKAR